MQVWWGPCWPLPLDGAMFRRLPTVIYRDIINEMHSFEATVLLVLFVLVSCQRAVSTATLSMSLSLPTLQIWQDPQGDWLRQLSPSPYYYWSCSWSRLQVSQTRSYERAFC